MSKIKHPDYYNNGIEMWDYAHSHNLSFYEGNIIKYVARAGKKKDELQDLLKAQDYLQREINLLRQKD